MSTKVAMVAGLRTRGEMIRAYSAARMRKEFKARVAGKAADTGLGAASPSLHGALQHAALLAARQAVLAMRDSDEIGDDAFRRLEKELDWIEMAGGQDATSY